MEGDAALGLPDKYTRMRSSGPGPKRLLWQVGQIPRPGSGEEGVLGAAGVVGLGAGPHKEDAPNPNRGLWQLAAALLMETEQQPRGG